MNVYNGGQINRLTGVLRCTAKTNKNDYNVIHLLGLLHCNIINLKAVMSFSSDGCSGPVYFLHIAVKVLFPSCQGD